MLALWLADVSGKGPHSERFSVNRILTHNIAENGNVSIFGLSPEVAPASAGSIGQITL